MAHDRYVDKKLASTANRFFLRTEQFVYIALAVILLLTTVLAMAGLCALLIDGLHDWTGTTVVFEIIDRLLFVLMLVEILYTVRASIESGALSSEPFLIVGLIACIRRILVISLETSSLTQPNNWTSESSDLFHAAMLELGVLGGLVVVMVGAIWFIRQGKIP
jgi:uncharacterized membrane protein (DUF373 family)